MLRYVFSAVRVKGNLSLLITIRRFVDVDNLKESIRCLSSYILRYSIKDLNDFRATSICLNSLNTCYKCEM